MVMIAHQTIGQDLSIEAGERLGDDLKQSAPVLVIDEDRLVPLSTSSDVKDGAGEFYAQRSGHAGTLRQEGAKGKA